MEFKILSKRALMLRLQCRIWKDRQGGESHGDNYDSLCSHSKPHKSPETGRVISLKGTKWEEEARGRRQDTNAPPLPPRCCIPSFQPPPGWWIAPKSAASGRQETETSPKVPLPPKIGCFRRLLRKTQQQQQQGGRFSKVFFAIFSIRAKQIAGRITYF